MRGGMEGSRIGGRKKGLGMSEVGGGGGGVLFRRIRSRVRRSFCLESGGDREGGCRRGFLFSSPLLSFVLSLPPLHYITAAGVLVALDVFDL